MVFLPVPKILIVSATKAEITPLANHLGITFKEDTGLFVSTGITDLSILITGVGMVNTAYFLGKYSTSSYDYIINAGICGAFNKTLNLGEVVRITQDILSEMGAENDLEFIPYLDLNLEGTNSYKDLSDDEPSSLKGLKKVKGITVNTVHGNEETIKKTIELFQPDIESMEGAAFFRACQGLSKNFIQVRAISNYVEKRDKSKWDIPLAVKNLNDILIKLIAQLNLNS